MKAVRLVDAGGRLRASDVPLEPCRDGEVTVQIRAAGICRSDTHYRSGLTPTGSLPLTLGHEIAGIVDQIGPGVNSLAVGDRVCVHYLVSCGKCDQCGSGHEQFCSSGSMIGKDRDGGYAEAVTLPARNAVRLPDSVPFPWGAVMMCSSSTSLHALRKGRFLPGERVAVFGVGGLGGSAIQIARALGASEVYGVDIKAAKLQLAEKLGAIPIDGSRGSAAAQIKSRTGEGVDVALELIGAPGAVCDAIRSLAPRGRAVLAGITREMPVLDPYADFIAREAELIGVSDHTLLEIHELLELVCDGRLDLEPVLTDSIPLDEGAVNAALDRLEEFGSSVRTVISTEG